MVCAGVVCAVTPQHEWGRPLCGRTGPTHECCARVAAQTMTVQTVGVVNFYSAMKTKQCTAARMNRHAETSLAGNAIEMEASIETE